jgi:hypothetical protein
MALETDTTTEPDVASTLFPTGKVTDGTMMPAPQPIAGGAPGGVPMPTPGQPFYQPPQPAHPLFDALGVTVHPSVHPMMLPGDTHPDPVNGAWIDSHQPIPSGTPGMGAPMGNPVTASRTPGFGNPAGGAYHANGDALGWGESTQIAQAKRAAGSRLTDADWRLLVDHDFYEGRQGNPAYQAGGGGADNPRQAEQQKMLADKQKAEEGQVDALRGLISAHPKEAADLGMNLNSMSHDDLLGVAGGLWKALNGAVDTAKRSAQTDAERQSEIAAASQRQATQIAATQAGREWGFDSTRQFRQASQAAQFTEEEKMVGIRQAREDAGAIIRATATADKNTQAQAQRDAAEYERLIGVAYDTNKPAPERNVAVQQAAALKQKYGGQTPVGAPASAKPAGPQTGAGFYQSLFPTQ